MDKVSVIIPVYNAEKYLGICIESIIKQTYKNIEIIFINDGSKDSSLKICNEFKDKDERIKVISKENGGVSSARNLGILNATGKYICFVDSDDYIDDTLIEVLYNTLIKNDADISMCNYIKVKGEKFEYVSADINQSILKGNQVVYDLLIPLIERKGEEEEHNLYGFRGPVVKLFKKEIIDENSLAFKENLKIGEDFVFNLEYLIHTNTVAINREFLYYYETNTESATRRYKNQCWDEIYKKTILEVQAFLQKHNLLVEAEDRLNRLILKYFFICIYNELKSTNNIASRIKNINSMCKDEFIKNAIENINIKEYKNKKRIILQLYKAKLYHLIYVFVAIVK